MSVDCLETTAPDAAGLARCLACAEPLDGAEVCRACGRAHPVIGGILEAMGLLSGANRIAAGFYDGPGWARFRRWERLFLAFQGGQIRARRPILRHLPRVETARVLEVGIGDGENVALLPPTWDVYGVDIARTQLVACLARHPRLAGRLVLAEAERLPFPDGAFDAAFTVGGFNHFGDHGRALRELRRVTRPGGVVIVGDERPDLRRFALGSLLGFEALDRWSLGLMGLDPAFAGLAFGCRLDVDAVARRDLPGCRRFPIWNRLGYCLVHPAPRNRAGAGVMRRPVAWR